MFINARWIGLFLIILQCGRSYLQIKTHRTISTNKKKSMKTKGPVVCTEHCRTQFIKYTWRCYARYFTKYRRENILPESFYYNMYILKSHFTSRKLFNNIIKFLIVIKWISFVCSETKRQPLRCVKHNL